VNNKKYIIAIIVLATTALACSIFIGGPAYPDSPIPISRSATDDLQTYIQRAVAEGAKNGIITLQITESELTSYLKVRVESQNNPVITEPQVILSDGQMKVYGKMRSSIFSANVSITTRVSVNNGGQPQIEIIQADLGPFPTPQPLNDAVTAFLDEAFTGSLGPIVTGFRLESISITNGIMTVTGRDK